MHVTKRAEGRPERAPGWGSQAGTELHWLADRELGGSELGTVGRITIEPGAGLPLHSHPGAEAAVFVLAGAGTATVAAGERRLRQGNALYAPAGAAYAIAAGGTALDLLVVLGAPGAAAAGWEDGPVSGAEARVLSGEESEEVELDDAATGFVGMHARWLVNDEICASDAVVLGRSRFAPGDGAHELHRHASAAEFFIVLSGEGVQLDEDGTEVAVEPGDLALLDAGSWHGFRNKGSDEVSAVFGFLGAPGLDQAGYELPESQPA
jgi:quercetin dioxygenase-like cupin family protein